MVAGHEAFVFSDFLRAYRGRHGMSQTELGERVGRGRNTIGAWERGSIPSQADILLLEEELYLDRNEVDLLLYLAGYGLKYNVSVANLMPAGTNTRDTPDPSPEPTYGYLHLRQKEGYDRTFVLQGTASWTIGRHPVKCDFVIPTDYLHVSRVHATLSLSQGTIYLRDEGSTRGTFIEGERVIEPYPLQVGQHILLGGRYLREKVCVLEYLLIPGETE